MDGYERRPDLTAAALVMPIKAVLVAPLRGLFRGTERAREGLRRIVAHASLAAQLHPSLPASVVVLGRAHVYGTGAVYIGKDTLLYPDLHLETQEHATISLGDGAVVSRGVHLVAMAGIVIGRGTMIGEYSSVRDGNHNRKLGRPMRESGHCAEAIWIGEEVWIGRGVAVLAGVSIGDGATIGANAVVTRDVLPGAVVGGVPARSLRSGSLRSS